MSDNHEIECRIVIVQTRAMASVAQGSETLSTLLSQGLQIHDVKFRDGIIVYTLIGPRIYSTSDLAQKLNMLRQFNDEKP